MNEREKLILDRLAQVLPYMPESLKERLMGYGDCMAEVMRQSVPVTAIQQSGATIRTTA